MTPPMPECPASSELLASSSRSQGISGGGVRTAILKADSMHRNFYEGLATREDVENSLREVERLVSAIGERVEGQR